MLQLVWWCKVQKYRSQGIHGCSPTQCGLLIYNISNTLQWAVRRGSRWSSSFILYEGINQIANQELIAESSSLSCSCWDWSGQSGVTVDSQNHGTCHSTSDPQPRRLELTSVNSHLENTFSRQTPSCLWWLLWAEEISPKAVSARSHVPSICQWIDWLLFWIGF